MSDYFKSPEYEEELRAVDLSPIIAEIDQYNQQFSMGHMLARGILGKLENENGDSPEQIENEGQQAFLQRIENQYGIALAKSGTGLEPIKSGATLFMPEGKVSSSELRINLTDRRQFLNYLAAIKPEQITSNQITGLHRVVESLTKQLAEEYSLDKPDPRADELVQNLKDILAAVDRLDPTRTNGLHDASETLAKYKKAADQKYLKEYLMVERSGFMLEIGGKNFGPSRWHTDSTEAEYQRRWDEALATLQQLKKNTNAADLCIDLSASLAAAANYAKKDLETIPVADRDLRISAKLVILDKVTRTLTRRTN